jgi:redox-sensitive bicupin YhaK (pirin superfamily)
VIELRRANRRHHDRRNGQHGWHTFFPDEGPGAGTDGFGVLEGLNEHWLPPGTSVPRRPPGDSEAVTYVHEGALAQEDSLGRSGVVQTGEFQRMTVRRRIRHKEANASRTERAHVYQLWLRQAEAGLDQSYEQRRFSTADRRGVLCVVASPDGRRGSLRIHPDVLVYSTLLDVGQHVIHELGHGRRAWVHVVRGEVMLGDAVLVAGDGAGVSGERAVSLTARQGAEVLVLDIEAAPPEPTKVA